MHFLCSAGVGRSGTLIGIDIGLEQAAKEGVVDIAAVVSKLREQRMKMVQTVVSQCAAEIMHHYVPEFL